MESTLPSETKGAGAFEPASANRAVSKQRRRYRLRRLLALVLLAVVAWLGVPPAMVGIHLFRARQSFDEIDVDAAIASLHRAEWWQSHFPIASRRAEVQYLLGAAYRRSEHFGRAHERFGRARELGYQEMDVARQELLMQFQMGYVNDTEITLATSLLRGTSDSEAEDVYEALVTGYLSEFRVQDAENCVNYWLLWRPDSLRGHLTRAHFLGSISDTVRLKAELREVLKIDPKRVRERLALAESLVSETNVDEALVECEICRRLAPGDPRVHLRLGVCLYHKGRPEEAKRELEAALAAGLDPTRQLEALTILAQLAAGSGDFETAVRHYTESVKLRPNDAPAEYGLGTCYSKLGKDDLAKPHLDRAKRLTQQSDRLAVINQHLALDAGNVDLRLEAAAIMVDWGREADAASWMLSVLRCDPTRREANELVAAFYEKHGKTDLAKQHRDAAQAAADQQRREGAPSRPATTGTESSGPVAPDKPSPGAE
ncbi:MAG TPA: tetratricopeptide repeat protein [Pirellulales bacterium]|jgi:tetratricopeptide (TPR) repeat protein|nr:tetratricopeptide repeat protein [Pirellulales bacterium]